MKADGFDPMAPKMRALVTRPREEAEGLASALAERGVEAVIEPMMQIRFRDMTPDLTGIQAVLCTSANGVRALARASGERRVPILAVGNATAACAQSEGFSTVASAGGNAGDLIRLAVDQLRPGEGPLLHVSGTAVAGDLAGDLRAHGFDVGRSVLYETEPMAALSAAAIAEISTGNIDFALFFSPRTAAIFVRLARAAGIAQHCETVTALSLSSAVDKALEALPWHLRRVAARPDQPALLDLLDQVCSERRSLNG